MVTVPDSWEKPVKYATLNTKLFIVGIVKSIFISLRKMNKAHLKILLKNNLNNFPNLAAMETKITLHILQLKIQ